MLHINKQEKYKFMYSDFVRIATAKNMFFLGWSSGVCKQGICDAHYGMRTLSYPEYQILDDLRNTLQESRYKELENEPS